MFWGFLLLMRLTECKRKKLGIVTNKKLSPRHRAGVEVTDGLGEASEQPPVRVGAKSWALPWLWPGASTGQGSHLRISLFFSSIPVRRSQRGDTWPLREEPHGSPWLRKAGAPVRGCPPDCYTPVTPSMLCPRLEKASPSPGGAHPRPPRPSTLGEPWSEASPGPLSNRHTAETAPPTPGPSWAVRVTATRRLRPTETAERGFPRGSRYEARSSPPPAATATAARRVTAVNRPTERP